jgi:hypothetical protein
MLVLVSMTVLTTFIRRVKYSKILPALAMKECKGSRARAPLFHLWARDEWLTSCPGPSTQGGNTSIPTEWGAGWAPELGRMFWRRKLSLPLLGSKLQTI